MKNRYELNIFSVTLLIKLKKNLNFLIVICKINIILYVKKFTWLVEEFIYLLVFLEFLDCSWIILVLVNHLSISLVVLLILSSTSFLDSRLLLYDSCIVESKINCCLNKYFYFWFWTDFVDFLNPVYLKLNIDV